MRLFEKYTAHLPNCDREVEVAREAEGFMVRTPAPADTNETLLTWEEAACGRVLVRMGGCPLECRISRLSDGTWRIEWRGRQVLVRVADDLAERARLAHAAHAGPMPLRSPMPGMVVKVLVEEGDLVTLEQPLLVVEAMKMQNELAAPVAGKVVNLSVKPGQAVEGDQVLLEIRA
jgi:pyruvate carboxylase subunit B